MPKRHFLVVIALFLTALSIQSDAILRPNIALAQIKTIPAPEDVLGRAQDALLIEFARSSHAGFSTDRSGM